MSSRSQEPDTELARQLAQQARQGSRDDAAAPDAGSSNATT